MRSLLPYLALYRHQKWALMFGLTLTILTLLTSVNLLVLSGWFLVTSAVAGISGLYTVNYMLPALGVRGMAIARIIGRYWERLVSHDTTFRILQNLRIFSFSRLMPLSPSGLACFRQGELLNCVVSDIDTLDQLYLRVISPMAGAFAVTVLIMFGLSCLDLTLALTLGVMLLMTLFFLPPLLYWAGKPIGEDLTRLRGKYRQQLTSWLHAQAELALFGAAHRYRSSMNRTELHWHRAQDKESRLNAFSEALMTLISGIIVISILWISKNELGHHPQPGALISVFVFCSLASVEVIAPITGVFQHLGQVNAAAKRITQLTDQLPKVQFTEKYIQIPSRVAISLQKVTFIYDGQIQPALSKITLDIPAGNHVAIIGRTGCGKSTLLQIITRAWDPHQGQININATPLADFSEFALRRTVSVVTQRVHLFSATLRDNLLLSAPDLRDEQLRAVLKEVGLQKLLVGKNLNTWLGEGGRQLSGGELRLLAIARALLHNAPLMLLDEPTEGLDAATEWRILQLLKRVTKNKTVLMVTHRLNGLENFDRIIVMDNGKIVGKDHHVNLLARQGRYFQFKKPLLRTT